jgi:hypothetical protein
MVTAAMAAVSPAACGGGSGGGKNGSDPSGLSGNGASASPLTKLSVPPGYDRSKGWEQALTWMTEVAPALPVAASFGSDAVAYLNASEDGYVAEVRDIRTGKVRWSGKR